MTVKFTRPPINIRETLDTLHKPSGNAGEAMLRAETPQEQFNLIGAGRRNLLINGGFDVWQRGTTLNSSGFLADRWYINASTNSTTHSRQAFNYGQTEVEGSPRYFLRMGINASSTRQLIQYVEDVRQFHNQTVTFSFWAKANKNMTPSVRLYSIYDGSNTEMVYQEEISVGTEWRKYVATATFPSFSGKSIGADSCLQTDLTFFNDDTYEFDFAQAQLEFGSVATPFERRSFGEELALCQRYYTVLAAGADYPEAYSGGSSHIIGTMHKWNSTNTFIFTDLPTQMRSSNSMTLVKSSGEADFAFKSAGYTSTGNDLSLDGDSSNRSIRINSAVTNSSWPLGCSGWVRCNTTSAFVALDAELS